MQEEQTMFQQQQSTNNSQTNQSEQPSQTAPSVDNNSTLSTLVGEGKRYSDNESLAKSKLEGDKHILNLEDQIKEIREELGKRETAEEIAKQLRTERQPESPQIQANTPQGVTGEQVADIVRDTITNIEASRTSKENLRVAEEAFKKVHGDNTQKMLSDKAKELGMSLEDLGNIAGKSPTAFAKMVGLDNKVEVPRDQSPMDGDQNTEALKVHQNTTQVNEGSKAYWNAKRKEMGHAAYFTPAIQQQVLKDKIEGRYDT